MADRPQGEPLTPEQILALPDGARYRVRVQWMRISAPDFFLGRRDFEESDRLQDDLAHDAGEGIIRVWLAED